MKNNKHRLAILSKTDINLNLNKNINYLSALITIESIAKHYNMEIFGEYINIVDRSKQQFESAIKGDFFDMIKDAKSEKFDEIIVVHTTAFTQYDFDLIEYHTTENGFFIPTTYSDDFILRSGVSRPCYLDFIKYIARRNNS
jgi:hypothetical protein